MAKRRIPLILLCCFVWSSAAFSAGTAGAGMLARRLDARTAALGGADVALGSDAAAASGNPAALAGLKGLDLSFLHLNGFLGTGT